MITFSLEMILYLLAGALMVLVAVWLLGVWLAARSPLPPSYPQRYALRRPSYLWPLLWVLLLGALMFWLLGSTAKGQPLPPVPVVKQVLQTPRQATVAKTVVIAAPKTNAVLLVWNNYTNAFMVIASTTNLSSEKWKVDCCN